MELATARLVLRDFTAADFAAVHAYATDAEVVRYMPWGPNTPADTRAFLERAAAGATARPRHAFELAVVEAAKGTVVGGVGLLGDGVQGMLGYCLARSAWGRGYATEAARALVAFAFAELGLQRVWARCDLENAASLRVLAKAGLRREGCAPRAEDGVEDGRETVHFGLAAAEWRRTP